METEINSKTKILKQNVESVTAEDKHSMTGEESTETDQECDENYQSFDYGLRQCSSDKRSSMTKPDKSSSVTGLVCNTTMKITDNVTSNLIKGGSNEDFKDESNNVVEPGSFGENDSKGLVYDSSITPRKRSWLMGGHKLVLDDEKCYSFEEGEITPTILKITDASESTGNESELKPKRFDYSSYIEITREEGELSTTYDEVSEYSLADVTVVEVKGNTKELDKIEEKSTSGMIEMCSKEDITNSNVDVYVTVDCLDDVTAKTDKTLPKMDKTLSKMDRIVPNIANENEECNKLQMPQSKKRKLPTLDMINERTPKRRYLCIPDGYEETLSPILNHMRMSDPEEYTIDPITPILEFKFKGQNDDICSSTPMSKSEFNMPSKSTVTDSMEKDLTNIDGTKSATKQSFFSGVDKSFDLEEVGELITVDELLADITTLIAADSSIVQNSEEPNISADQVKSLGEESKTHSDEKVNNDNDETVIVIDDKSVSKCKDLPTVGNLAVKKFDPMGKLGNIKGMGTDQNNPALTAHVSTGKFKDMSLYFSKIGNVGDAYKNWIATPTNHKVSDNSDELTADITQEVYKKGNLSTLIAADSSSDNKSEGPHISADQVKSQKKESTTHSDEEIKNDNDETLIDHKSVSKCKVIPTVREKSDAKGKLSIIKGIVTDLNKPARKGPVSSGRFKDMSLYMSKIGNVGDAYNNWMANKTDHNVSDNSDADVLDILCLETPYDDIDAGFIDQTLLEKSHLVDGLKVDAQKDDIVKDDAVKVDNSKKFHKDLTSAANEKNTIEKDATVKLEKDVIDAVTDLDKTKVKDVDEDNKRVTINLKLSEDKSSKIKEKVSLVPRDIIGEWEKSITFHPFTSPPTTVKHDDRVSKDFDINLYDSDQFRQSVSSYAEVESCRRWGTTYKGAPVADVNLTVATTYHNNRLFAGESPKVGFLEGDRIVGTYLYEDDISCKLNELSCPISDDRYMAKNFIMNRLRSQKLLLLGLRNKTLEQLKLEIESEKMAMKENHVMEYDNLKQRHGFEIDRMMGKLRRSTNYGKIQKTMRQTYSRQDAERHNLRNKHTNKFHSLCEKGRKCLDKLVSEYDQQSKSIDDIIKQMHCYYNQLDESSPFGPLVYVRLKKGACIETKRKPSFVDVSLPAAVAQAVLLEDDLYDFHYRY
ncbi:hypothetical protein ACF0H5_008213 [Mactra antiquata]